MSFDPVEAFLLSGCEICPHSERSVFVLQAADAPTGRRLLQLDLLLQPPLIQI